MIKKILQAAASAALVPGVALAGPAVLPTPFQRPVVGVSVQAGPAPVVIIRRLPVLMPGPAPVRRGARLPIVAGPTPLPRPVAQPRVSLPSFPAIERMLQDDAGNVTVEKITQAIEKSAKPVSAPVDVRPIKAPVVTTEDLRGEIGL